MDLMRVSGSVPERLSGGDDSSENSSESSCYEVMDTNGEIVHMAKRLTCRVKHPVHIPTQLLLSAFSLGTSFSGIFRLHDLHSACFPAAGEDQGSNRTAAESFQLCLLSIHLLGAW